MTETLDRRLQDTVDHLSSIAPPELFGVFSAEQKRLASEDDATRHIAVGDMLPAGQLRSPSGESHPVPAGPAVLVFYRGAWCPYCNVALAAYQREVLPELRERGIAFVAISPQGPDGSVSIAEQNELTFPVLTDPGSAFARELGLTFDLADDVKQAQLAFGNDFTTINAGGEWSLPKPTVVVVDEGGAVRFVDVRPDYTQRTEPESILRAVREIDS